MDVVGLYQAPTKKETLLVSSPLSVPITGGDGLPTLNAVDLAYRKGERLVDRHWPDSPWR